MNSKAALALQASYILCTAMLCAGDEVSSRPTTALDPAGDAVTAAQVQSERPAERPIFIGIPSALKPLKRAPLLFWHDKHTAALKTEGCEACHPRNKNTDKVEFSFPKERNALTRNTLMDSYHDGCITCHSTRSAANKSSGPVTCGECHSKKNAGKTKVYFPLLPSDHETIRESYLKNSAHKPDWKTFHVQTQDGVEEKRPQSTYDYVTHDKHVQALENKCELCHYLSPALKEKLAAEGRTPSSQDWLREEEPGGSLKQKDPAHARCINCHLNRTAEKKTHGPVECRECHKDRPRTSQEFKNVRVPDYDKKDQILISAKEVGLPAVPFNHKTHIAASRSCNDCHHETLEPCAKCHTLQGTKEGRFVTLAEAYHKAGSTRSCVGCHDMEKTKPDCAGCHSLRPAGLAATRCAVCHTGTLESLDRNTRLPDPTTLFPADLKEDLMLSALEKEYDAAQVKHTYIARKLTEISNNSRLATFFHIEETTICSGCHHLTPIEKQKQVSACGACHTAQNTPSDNSPTLLGAYHQACLGCHKSMGYPEEKMPQSCTGCHKEKTKQQQRVPEKL